MLRAGPLATPPPALRTHRRLLQGTQTPPVPLHGRPPLWPPPHPGVSRHCHHPHVRTTSPMRVGGGPASFPAASLPPETVPAHSSFSGNVRGRLGPPRVPSPPTASVPASPHMAAVTPAAYGASAPRLVLLSTLPALTGTPGPCQVRDPGPCPTPRLQRTSAHCPGPGRAGPTQRGGVRPSGMASTSTLLHGCTCAPVSTPSRSLGGRHPVFFHSYTWLSAKHVSDQMGRGGKKV